MDTEIVGWEGGEIEEKNGGMRERERERERKREEKVKKGGGSTFSNWMQQCCENLRDATFVLPEPTNDSQSQSIPFQLSKLQQ